MKVEQVRVLETDAAITDVVITIECECGNKRMIDLAGGFPGEEIFIFLQGVRVKNLRCSWSESRIRKKLAQGENECRERYRITVPGEVNRQAIEIMHVGRSPNDNVLETFVLLVPKKDAGKRAMYPYRGYPEPNPFRR